MVGRRDTSPQPDIRALVRGLAELRRRLETLERRFTGTVTAQQALRAFDLLRPQQDALHDALGRILTRL